MAAVQDSLWVAEDIVLGGSEGVTQTWTDDVSAFTVDVNDPEWSPGNQGVRTAWLKVVAPHREGLSITESGGVIVGVFSWDGSSTPVKVASAVASLTVSVPAGIYLVGVSAATTLNLGVTFARSRGGMLLRGVGGAGGVFASSRPFDLGGIGVMTSWRPFDVLCPLVSKRSNRPFDIQGTVGITSTRPFDMGTGGLLVTSPRPFDVINETDGQNIWPIVYVPPSVEPVNCVQVIVVSATGGWFTLTFDGSTTGAIDWDATPGEVQAALETLPNIASGDVLVTGSYRVEFTGAYAGMPVPLIGITSYLTGPSVVAATTMQQPGLASGAAAELPGIQVYDKAGSRLGSIHNFSVGDPPSRAVNFRGAFSFTVPRVLVDSTSGATYPNPDVFLLPEDVVVRGDRLLVLGDSSRPADPWGGVITNTEWTDGSVIVQCADVMDLLSTPQLPEDNIARATQAILIPDDTLARDIVWVLMNHANTWYGANGEVLWGVDATGNKTFFGYETITGDVESALAMVVERTFGEWCWRIELTPTSMRPVIVWRDSFIATAGPDLFDGPDGNVVAGPSLSVELTSVVNAIRITGSVTTIESKIPEGATALPYPELIPVAEVWLPTEGYRRRFNSSGAGILLNIEVPFTLEESTQDELAAMEEAKRRALFESFIHAFHAQFGRPWHDEWSWAGGNGNDEPDEDEDFERKLTADLWVHYRSLAISAVPTTVLGDDLSAANPLAVVMKGTSTGTASPTKPTTAPTRNYTVRSGDTLWAIAGRYYGNPLLWPVLYALNKEVIDRTARAHGYTSNFAHWIFPGEVLKVPA
jgi:hypothetical protein